MRRLIAALLSAAVALSVGACDTNRLDDPDPPDRAFRIDIRVAGATTRSAADAVRITREYLAAMRDEIASPQIHVVANVQSVWSVAASDAWTIDPCIPKQDDDRPVWITMGDGDYLNLDDREWSKHFGQFDEGFELACRGAARSGTLVIDDTTGEILGVFPGDHTGLGPSVAPAATARPPSTQPYDRLALRGWLVGQVRRGE